MPSMVPVVLDSVWCRTVVGLGAAVTVSWSTSNSECCALAREPCETPRLTNVSLPMPARRGRPVTTPSVALNERPGGSEPIAGRHPAAVAPRKRTTAKYGRPTSVGGSTVVTSAVTWSNVDGATPTVRCASVRRAPDVAAAAFSGTNAPASNSTATSAGRPVRGRRLIPPRDRAMLPPRPPACALPPIEMRRSGDRQHRVAQGLRQGTGQLRVSRVRCVTLDRQWASDAILLRPRTAAA